MVQFSVFVTWRFVINGTALRNCDVMIDDKRLFWRDGFSVSSDMTLVRHSLMFPKAECLRTEGQAFQDAVYHQQRRRNSV